MYQLGMHNKNLILVLNNNRHYIDYILKLLNMYPLDIYYKKKIFHLNNNQVDILYMS